MRFLTGEYVRKSALLSLTAVTAAVMLAGPDAAHAQGPFPSPDRFLISYEKIPTPDLGAVNAIVRDVRGFLWFGTTKGLCKYDGYGIRLYTVGPASWNGLPEDVVALLKSGDTALVLGTGKGLWNFDLRTGRANQAEADPEVAGGRITALARDIDGALLVGTASSGVFRYGGAPGRPSRYSTKNGLSDDRITAILAGRAGRVWIGTREGGLNLVDPSASHVAQYRAAPSGSLWSDQIAALCEIGDELWIGTSDGLNILGIGSGRVRRVDLPSDNPHAVRAIAAGPAAGAGTGLHTMYIGIAELGLYTSSAGKLAPVDPADDGGRSLSSIRVIYPDPVSSTGSNTLLWIGERHSVVRMPLSANPFTNHLRNRGPLELNRGAVLSFCGSRDGILWVGLWGGGLNGLRREGGSYRRIAGYQSRPGSSTALPGNDVNALAEDSSGHLWIGTNGGLALLDPARHRMEAFRHDDADSASLPGDQVTRLMTDRSGALWITTTRGLSRLGPGPGRRFTNYLHEPADAHPLGRNEVSDVVQDREGNIWASTYGRGLNRIGPGGRITRFLDRADTAGTLENFIYVIAEDDSGNFWLSTTTGLVRFDPRSGVYTRLDIAELHGAHIFGIETDRAGYVWLSTGIGLARYHPRTGSFARFDRERGVAFEELFSDFYRTGSGALLAGGIDGFLEFSPGKVSTRSMPPEIAITGFSVLDREIPDSARTAGPLRLPHDQNFLSFSFAALDYRNPLQNRFAYRMEGVDDHWIDAGTHNYASYTHLDPGEYVFRVKGCNSENVWNEAGTSMAVTIMPPYWRTWWFRLIAAGLLAGSIYAAYRYRMRKILEMERLRLRIADDLHDDVGSNLSTIAIVSRSLRNAPGVDPGIRSKLTEIYDTAVQTSEGMRDIVWFIKPKDDTLDDLLLRMKETAASQFREIEYSFRSPKSNDQSSIAIEFKRNVYLAFKEIVTNIVKHAGATRVEIGIAVNDGAFEMAIADNGKGFDVGGRHQGSGLSSLQKRARALGGVCEFRSEPGKGSTVRFTAKVKGKRRA